MVTIGLTAALCRSQPAVSDHVERHMLHGMQQTRACSVLRAGSMVARVLPRAKYIPVEVPFACWLAGGGCWRWFTLIAVMLIYDLWIEQEQKLASGDKVTIRLEFWQTWRLRRCKQNFIINCSAVTMRTLRIVSFVWLLETWDTVWEDWLFFAISSAWWFAGRMISLGCLVCKVVWYPISLGWWMAWKVVLLVWPVVVYMVSTPVVQLLWWLLKLGAEIFLHFMHVITYIDRFVPD